MARVGEKRFSGGPDPLEAAGPTTRRRAQVKVSPSWCTNPSLGPRREGAAWGSYIWHLEATKRYSSTLGFARTRRRESFLSDCHFARNHRARSRRYSGTRDLRGTIYFNILIRVIRYSVPRIMMARSDDMNLDMKMIANWRKSKPNMYISLFTFFPRKYKDIHI